MKKLINKALSLLPEYLPATLLAFLAALFQTTLFPRVFDCPPDLILALVCAYSIRKSENVAVYFALLSSFLADTTGSVGFSVMPFFYIALALVFSGVGRSTRSGRTFFSFLIFYIPALILREGVTLLLTSIRFSFDLDIVYVLSTSVLKESVFGLILGPAAYLAATPFCLRKKEKGGVRNE